MPTLTLKQNPPMICKHGVPSRSFPKFTKYTSEVLPDRHYLQEFFDKHDQDEMVLLDYNTNETWHAIRTLANRERDLARMCQNLKLSYFLPMVKVRARSGNRFHITQRLVFPGFLFVLLKPSDKVRILSTQRVASILTVNGNNAQKYFQKELLSIKRACLLHNKINHPNRVVFKQHRSTIQLLPGQKARFIEGHPLHNTEVTITHTYPTNGKVDVQLQVAMLGSSVFETHQDNLERITQ